MKSVGIPIFGEKSANLNTAYINYVANAGYLPVLINNHNIEDDRLLNACDALMLPGGIDVDPLHYYEDNVSSINVNPSKDDFERNLLYTFINSGKKVFGICRGFQLIIREALFEDVALRTKLHFYQHVGGHSQKDNGVARPCYSHTVRLAEKHLYGNGEDIASGRVNSMHHQALVLPSRKDTKEIEVGSTIGGNTYNIAITAASYKNVPSKAKFIVEGFQIEGLGVSAVQWHPEELEDFDLLRKAIGD